MADRTPRQEWLKALEDRYWLGGDPQALEALKRLNTAMTQMYADNDRHTELMRQWSETHDITPEKLNAPDKIAATSQVKALQGVIKNCSRGLKEINLLWDITTPQTWRSLLLSAGLDKTVADQFIREMVSDYQRDKDGYNNLSDYLHAHAKGTRIDDEGWLTKIHDDQDNQRILALLEEVGGNFTQFLKDIAGIESRAKKFKEPLFLKTNVIDFVLINVQEKLEKMQANAQDRINRVTTRWPEVGTSGTQSLPD